MWFTQRVGLTRFHPLARQPALRQFEEDDRLRLVNLEKDCGMKVDANQDVDLRSNIAIHAADEREVAREQLCRAMGADIPDPRSLQQARQTTGFGPRESRTATP
jgi:hypothetical protein